MVKMHKIFDKVLHYSYIDSHLNYTCYLELQKNIWKRVFFTLGDNLLDLSLLIW